jgi:uncharacterized membrane protein YkvA (DUF1232 family)
MNNRSPDKDIERTAGILGQILRQIKLVWQLMIDPQVSLWVKLIPPIAILYLLSPIDLVPDPILGLGQLDDLAVLLIAVKLFIEMSSSDAGRRVSGKTTSDTPPYPENEVVDASYRVIDD